MAEGRRICTVCRERKPLEAFGVDKKNADGLRPQCKRCTADAAARRRLKVVADLPEPIREARVGTFSAAFGTALDADPELLEPRYAAIVQAARSLANLIDDNADDPITVARMMSHYIATVKLCGLVPAPGAKQEAPTLRSVSDY